LASFVPVLHDGLSGPAKSVFTLSIGSATFAKQKAVIKDEDEASQIGERR